MTIKKRSQFSVFKVDKNICPNEHEVFKNLKIEKKIYIFLGV